jgi:hypothetical protein
MKRSTGWNNSRTEEYEHEREATMTFGFPAHHEERYGLQIDPVDIERMVKEVLYDFSWGIINELDGKIKVKIGISLSSWGEIVEIDYSNKGYIDIRSKCSLRTQCIDWGKNRRNVEKFILRLEDKLD